MSPAGKDKKGCPTLPRMEQDTCHTLFAEEKKSVEYYFASDARSDSSLCYSLYYSYPTHATLDVFFWMNCTFRISLDNCLVNVFS